LDNYIGSNAHFASLIKKRIVSFRYSEPPDC
jgi:hypothetical protein